MWSVRTLAAIVVLVSLLTASPAHGQVPRADTLYTLTSPPSEFVSGCFGPCECAVTMRATLAGSFVLHRARSGPLLTEYDVRDVRWVATGSGEPIEITGAGTYRRGDGPVPFAQIELDLSFDRAPPLHFTSRRGDAAPFPQISARLWLHAEACNDSLLVVNATPAGGISGGGD